MEWSVAELLTMAALIEWSEQHVGQVLARNYSLTCIASAEWPHIAQRLPYYQGLLQSIPPYRLHLNYTEKSSRAVSNVGTT
jgi:hypothetical protein